MKMLSEKQRLFADEYLIDLNVIRAYKAAGYKGNEHVAAASASRMLKNVDLAAYIQQKTDERSDNLGITHEYVLTTIKETIERCRQVERVTDSRGKQVMVSTPDGELAAAFTYDSKAVLKGTELLGRHLKMFTDRVEHSGSVAIESAILAGRKRARR